jgi:hypothetical protein
VDRDRTDSDCEGMTVQCAACFLLETRDWIFIWTPDTHILVIFEFIIGYTEVAVVCSV